MEIADNEDEKNVGRERERHKIILDFYKRNPRRLTLKNRDYFEEVIEAYGIISERLSRIIQGNLLKESLRKC